MIVSFLAASLFILLMLPLPRFAGERRWYLIGYHAPIGLVFVNYLFDRLRHRREIRLWQWGVEAGLIALALFRAIFTSPPISGHTLFLSYLLIVTPFRPVWWLSAVVFVEVILIKVAVLNDSTWMGGVLVGLACGLAVWWGKRQTDPPA